VKSIYNPKQLELMVISSPSPVAHEFDFVNQMFEEGLNRFHLRKPDLDKAGYLEALQCIKPQFLKRVILHDHFALALSYNVGGFYIKSEVLQKNSKELELVIKGAKGKGLLLSTGVHSINELASVPKTVDYMFLSPVFDSISKPGYQANMDLEKVAKAIKINGKKHKIMALGGIDLHNLSIVKETGFDGAAVLGAIWQSENPVVRLKQLNSKVLAL
jgi:thiamine-phosphate pyrophosphorylase